MSETFQVRISKERFATVELTRPPGDWFTDGHLQEILVAFADSFKDNYDSTTPRVFRTPRCTFSLYVFRKSFKSYVFQPVSDDKWEACSSIPKTFCIRVLGRSDIGEALGETAEVDGAMRVVQPEMNQQPPSGYPQQPPPGYPQQTHPGYPQQPPPGYPQQPPGFPPGYPGYPPPGYPYPPPGYPYPGFPPQQQGGFDWEKGFTANTGNLGAFDWERQRGMAPPQQPPYPGQYPYPPYPGYPPPYPGYPPQPAPAPVQEPMFDWEKKNTPGAPKDEGTDIVIDWSYKAPKTEKEEEIVIERETSVGAKCTTKAFDRSRLPELSDEFYKFFPSDAQVEMRAQKRRQTFQKRQQAKTKDVIRIKFQFDHEDLRDLEVSANFGTLEMTNKLYSFLDEVIFQEGTKYKLFLPVPPKQIPSTNNQRLKDVKLTGNTFLNVKFQAFSGLAPAVHEQFTAQRTALAAAAQEE